MTQLNPSGYTVLEWRCSKRVKNCIAAGCFLELASAAIKLPLRVLEFPVCHLYKTYYSGDSITGQQRRKQGVILVGNLGQDPKHAACGRRCRQLHAGNFRTWRDKQTGEMERAD